MFRNTWLALAFVIAFSATSSAAFVEFVASDQKDNLSDLTVEIKVEDLLGGGVRITANVVGGAVDEIGDLIGLHFRVDGTAPATVSFANQVPLGVPIGYSTTSNAMNPYKFDMNFFVIGDNGLGTWDIQVVGFDVGGIGALTAESFTAAGARVTSVGTIGGSRRDSLKLIDTVPGTPNVEEIPEPSTWLLLSAGIGLLALARRRRRAV
ncbi:MAG: PEP-CTERM sorting domain-containing protein [Bryobacterales bacterium]|nr:PEP-CTERM sorting domain-containing protein [Bryobacterales bacterium]